MCWWSFVGRGEIDAAGLIFRESFSKADIARSVDVVEICSRSLFSRRFGSFNAFNGI